MTEHTGVRTPPHIKWLLNERAMLQGELQRLALPELAGPNDARGASEDLWLTFSLDNCRLKFTLHYAILKVKSAAPRIPGCLPRRGCEPCVIKGQSVVVDQVELGCLGQPRLGTRLNDELAGVDRSRVLRSGVSHHNNGTSRVIGRLFDLKYQGRPVLRARHAYLLREAALDDVAELGARCPVRHAHSSEPMTLPLFLGSAFAIA